MGLSEDQEKALDEVISEIKDKHGLTDATGEKECPMCGRRLFYAVIAYNGHTMGQCEDGNCLAWRE